MRLILLRDVASLGRKGDVVDVADGYARNFLLPRHAAREANRGALAALGEQKKAERRREEDALNDARALAGRIEAIKVAVRARAGENGRLFGAVTNADVAAAIAAAVAAPIDKHKVELNGQIKSIGSYPVEVKLHKSVVAKATIDVVAG